MKIFWLALLLTGTVYAQTSCTYDQTRGVTTSMCTLPDGSGVETWISATSVTEQHYAPAEWTKRLNAQTAAYNAETAALKKISHEIDLSNAAMDIHVKRQCVSAGFVWHRDGLFSGWCAVAETPSSPPAPPRLPEGPGRGK